MKIYIVGGNEEFIVHIKNVLEEHGIQDVTALTLPKVTPQQLREQAADCEILVASPSGFETVSKEHMEALPKLKFISTTSVGTDWVDVKAATIRGIIVSNEKGVNAEAVAEHVFGMILDLAKRITEADRDIRQKGEYRSSPYMGLELYGKTLGIIGTGDIGQKVARIANGFSMKIFGFNKSKRDIAGIGIVSLEKLLKDSDVIAVTLPLSSETENLLSDKEFNLMKEGVILVSISREKIINKDAVLTAVDSGKIRGFAFDAEIMIPIAKDDPYLKSPRIVITPHTASMTEEADKGYAEMTVENVKAFMDGSPMRVVI